MHRNTVYRVSLGVLCALLLAGCSGGDGTPGLSGGRAETPVARVAEPGALSPLAVPDGVDAELWGILNAELSRVLAERDANGVDAWGKLASVPPMGEASATVLSYNAGAATLSWRYYSVGDYNQDGLVGISDLTPLGQHYGEGSPLGAGQPFPPDTLGAAIDGNGDGVINISDITQIGQNYGVFIVGYNVYTSTDEGDYPASSSDDNGPETSQIGYLALADATSLTDERKLLEFALPEDTVAGYYWVRPTDGETDGTPSSLAQITEGDLNTPPIAVLSASPAEGLVPLTVSFHAFSSVDPDGVITGYHWDYDGEVGPLNWYDTGEQGWTEHTYTDAGNYFALLEVMDDDGGTTEDFVTIRVREPTPPVALFDCSQSSGPAPLYSFLNAMGSYDPDGYITRYEWDWDSNGEYNYNAEGEPTAENYYYAPGEYTVTLRVTDNDGLTAVSTHDVVVQEDAKWHAEAAVTESASAVPPTVGTLVRLPVLIDVGGNPALFYQSSYMDNINDPFDRLHYIRALDPYGTTWDEPVELYFDDDPTDVFKGYNPFHSVTVDGRPAVFFAHGPYNDIETWYLLADDETGNSWPSPVRVSEGDVEFKSPIAIIDGYPMFIQSNSLWRAEDSVGSSWERTQPFPGIGGSWSPSLLEVMDRPGVAFRFHNNLMYFRAFDAAGTSWPNIPLLLDSVSEVEWRPKVVFAAGNPAIVYYDATLRALKIMRAEDPEGNSWGAPLTIVAWTWGLHYLALLWNRPAIVYKDYASQDLMMIIANNEVGTNWCTPFVLELEASDTGTSSFATWGRQGFLTQVGDLPAIAITGGYVEDDINYYSVGVALYY